MRWTWRPLRLCYFLFMPVCHRQFKLWTNQEWGNSASKTTHVGVGCQYWGPASRFDSLGWECCCCSCGHPSAALQRSMLSHCLFVIWEWQMFRITSVQWQKEKSMGPLLPALDLKISLLKANFCRSTLSDWGFAIWTSWQRRMCSVFPWLLLLRGPIWYIFVHFPFLCLIFHGIDKIMEVLKYFIIEYYTLISKVSIISVPVILSMKIYPEKIT